MRGFKRQERILVLLGGLSVLILSGTVYYWNNDLATFLQVQFQDAYGWMDFRSGNFFTLIHLGLVGILILVTLFGRGELMGKKIAQVQRKIDTFYWGLLI